MKYANCNAVVAWSQGEVRLSIGMMADDDNALVLERPDLFDDEPVDVALKGRERLEQAEVLRSGPAPEAKTLPRYGRGPRG